jgi:hypothetical protein
MSEDLCHGTFAFAVKMSRPNGLSTFNGQDVTFKSVS